MCKVVLKKNQCFHENFQASWTSPTGWKVLLAALKWRWVQSTLGKLCTMFTILTILQHFQRSASQELQWVSLKVTKFVTLADGEEVCTNQSIVARLSRQANFYIAYATVKSNISKDPLGPTWHCANPKEWREKYVIKSLQLVHQKQQLSFWRDELVTLVQRKVQPVPFFKANQPLRCLFYISF